MYILIEFIDVNYSFGLLIELIIILIVLLFLLVGEKVGVTNKVSIFACAIVIVISLILFINLIKLDIRDIPNIFTLKHFVLCLT